MDDIIKDTNNSNPEAQSNDSVSLSKEEVKSLKNYAAAQARIAAEQKIKDGYVLKEDYNKVVAERDNLIFENNKTKFLDEYIKNGGKKDSFDTFCKYHKDIVIESDENKRKISLMEVSKIEPCFFTKQIASVGQIANSAPTPDVQEKQQPFYFDENGVLRQNKR